MPQNFENRQCRTAERHVALLPLVDSGGRHRKFFREPSAGESEPAAKLRHGLAVEGVRKAGVPAVGFKVVADGISEITGLGYQYNLSKSTRVYTGIGYTEGEYKYDGKKVKPDSLSTVAGLSYYF